MTYDEAKRAFDDGAQVKYKGYTYERINAIIFRRVAGEKLIQLELQDAADRSVTVARMEAVET